MKSRSELEPRVTNEKEQEREILVRRDAHLINQDHHAAFLNFFSGWALHLGSETCVIIGCEILCVFESAAVGCNTGSSKGRNKIES